MKKKQNVISGILVILAMISALLVSSVCMARDNQEQSSNTSFVLSPLSDTSEEPFGTIVIGIIDETHIEMCTIEKNSDVKKFLNKARSCQEYLIISKNVKRQHDLAKILSKYGQPSIEVLGKSKSNFEMQMVFAAMHRLKTKEAYILRVTFSQKPKLELETM